MATSAQTARSRAARSVPGATASTAARPRSRSAEKAPLRSFEADAEAHRARVHPQARPPLGLGQMRMRRGPGWQTSDLGIADVDGEGEQLQGVAEGGGRLLSPGEVHGEHAGGAVGEVATDEVRVGTARDARMVDPGDPGAAMQAPGERRGIGADLAHPQVEGLDAHQDLLRAGRRQRGPEVGDVLRAGVLTAAPRRRARSRRRRRRRNAGCGWSAAASAADIAAGRSALCPR